MVFMPGRPRGPKSVEGSYIVSPKAGRSIDDAAREIEELITQEKAEKTASIANKGKYWLLLKCDAAFAEKARTLPSVQAVEQEQMNYTQKRKPGGPGIGM